MAYYFGPEWRDGVQPSAATRKYVARVEEVAREAPYLLIAHMYTRYLGDLFGGQMMGGMARRSLDLDASLGTKLYEFDDIPAKDIKPFIEEWYAQLNKLELSDEQKERIVDEGNEVFRLNIEVFEELNLAIRRRRSSRSRSRRSDRRSASSAARFRATFRSGAVLCSEHCGYELSSSEFQLNVSELKTSSFQPTVTHAFATVINASFGSSSGKLARELPSIPPSVTNIGSSVPYGKHAATASRSTWSGFGTARWTWTRIAS